MTIVYVTTGAWGAGAGYTLPAATMDGNFYDVDQRLVTLNAALADGKRIDSISSSPNSVTFTFTDASTQVIPLPIAELTFVGQWTNSTPYIRGQLFIVPFLGLFQVLVDHTSPALPAAFDPDAVTDDTAADPLYAFLLPMFSINLPGGTAGQVVSKIDSTDYNIEWVTKTADLIPFDPVTGSTLTSTNVADALEEVSDAWAAGLAAISFDAVDITFDPNTDSELTSTNVADALDELGADKISTSEIGVTVQAYDAQLSSLVQQNSQFTAYTTVLTDGGKHILHPSADLSARTFTIDSNANVAYPIGTEISFVNQHGAGVITIAITSDTMRLAGAGTTGSRTLAADGIATALKIATTEWIISGTGLT